MTDKKIQVVFAPGCFDNFDGTQQELDEMMAEISRLVESGEILEQSQPVDIDAMTPAELAELAEAMGIDLDDQTGPDSAAKRTLQ